MSNNLQEINNLKETLLRQTQPGILGALTTHNLYERIDASTIKQLCVSCGGKGFYLLIEGTPDGSGHQSGQIVFCEECEDGFKYSKSLVEDHGG